MKRLLLLICLLTGQHVSSADSKPVRIGALFSLSGFGASVGNGDLDGATLAVEQINASGGIANRSVELVVEDSASDAKKAVSAFRKLAVIEGVSAVIGPNYTEFIEVVFPLADKLRMPTIGTSGYSARLFGTARPGHYSFVLWPSLSSAMEPMIAEIVKRRYRTVAAVVAQNAYYAELQRILAARLKVSGINLTTLEIAPDSNDLRSAISGVRAAHAEAVIVLLMETGQIASFFRQKKDLGLDVPAFADSHLQDDPLLAGDMELAEGVVFFRYNPSGDEAFTDAYRRRFRRPPGFTSARAYDAVYLVREAAGRCGLGAERLRTCLTTADYAGASGRCRFDDRGALASGPALTSLYRIEHKKAVPLDAAR